MKTGKNYRSRPWYTGILILAASALLMLPAACGTSENEESVDENRDSDSCASVDRAEVETRDLEEIIRAIGSTEAFQKVTVRPEIKGVIESVHFEEGAKVKKDDLLFSIDDAKVQAELRARQAALGEAEANRENARLIFERRQRLYEKNQISEEERDEARTGYEALKSQVKRIEAEVENIKETLKDTRVRAPFDGIAGEHHVDAGQLVDTATHLTSVFQTERLKIAFTTPERYLGDIRNGQEIRLTSPAYPEKKLSGTVYFMDPQIEMATRSLNLKARADNPDNLLRPGGFVSVELIAGVREDALVIPEEALIPTRTGYMVFTIEDSRASGREVEIGLRRPGFVEITQGLEKGETIVQAGHISLAEGDRVCSE
ncbi:MAG: efflux RND transporter periplasmic adaptor subunit [Thermodesulfobacteriota bacterium]